MKNPPTNRSCNSTDEVNLVDAPEFGRRPLSSNQSTGSKVTSMTDEIIVVSPPYLPGYRITKTIGFTWGLIVRSRGLGRNITAGLRSLAGGEIRGSTELLSQSREQALGRLKDHAKALGANAIVGVQFDSSDISYMTELLAYGTAVVVEKETEKISPVRLG